MDRYRFIFEHRTLWRVEQMYRVLEVSRSEFYAWQNAPPVVASKKPSDWIKRLNDSTSVAAVDRVVPKSLGRCGSKAGRSAKRGSLNA